MKSIETRSRRRPGIGRHDCRELSGWCAVGGAVIGTTDALDTMLGGFAPGFTALELAIVLAASVMLIAVSGAAAGLLLGGGLSFLRQIGFRWHDGRGLGFRDRLLLSEESAAGSLTGCIVGVVAGICAGYGWLLFGSGRRSSLALGVAIGMFVLVPIILAWILSRHRRSMRLHSALWLVSIAALFMLETRFVYMFARSGKLMGSVHAMLLLFMLWVAGCGLWLRRRRTATRGGPLAVTALLVGVAAALVSLVALECFGSHRVRLVMHERLSLAFQPLSLIPRCSERRFASIALGWQTRCASATPRVPASDPLATERARPRVRGVVLVLVDGLRSDRLDASRSRRPLMPNLSRLASVSATFPHTYTAAPGTTAAIRALIAGSFRGTDDPATSYQRPLAAALTQAGVKTIAVAGHKNLKKATGAFDVYDDRASIERFPEYKNALTSAHTLERVRAQIQALGPQKRFLLLAHFFDPHAHYVRNSRFAFGASEESRYDAEVSYTDYWLGKLFEEVRGLSNVAIVVTSDHGDEFWEHRYKRHQIRLYDESTRVPLIIWEPRLQGGARHGTDVSLIDLPPTLLDLLGARIPDTMQGRSLRPFLAKREALDQRPVFIHSTNLRRAGVVAGRRKLIVDRKTGIVEYYDMRVDPGERFNLADQGAPEDLACSLHDWMRAGGLFK